MASTPRKEAAARNVEPNARSHVDRNAETSHRRDKNQIGRIEDDGSKSNNVNPVKFNRSAEMRRLSGAVWDDRSDCNRKHTDRCQDQPPKYINHELTPNSSTTRRLTPSAMHKNRPTQNNGMDKRNIRKETVQSEGGFIRDQRHVNGNTGVSRKRTAKHNCASDEEASAKKNPRSSLSPAGGEGKEDVKYKQKGKQRRQRNSTYDREYQVNYCTEMVFTPQVNSSPKRRQDNYFGDKYMNEKENIYPGTFHNRSSKVTPRQSGYNYNKKTGKMNENESDPDAESGWEVDDYYHEETESRLNYSRGGNNTDSGFSEDMSETQSRVDEEEMKKMHRVMPKSTRYVNESQISNEESQLSSDEYDSDTDVNIEGSRDSPTPATSRDTSPSRTYVKQSEQHGQRKNKRDQTEFTELPMRGSEYSYSAPDLSSRYSKRHGGNRKSSARANSINEESKSKHRDHHKKNPDNTTANGTKRKACDSAQAGFTMTIANPQKALAQQNMNSVKDVKWTNAEKCAFLAVYRNENPYHAYDKANRWKIFSAHMQHLGVYKSNEQCRGQVST